MPKKKDSPGKLIDKTFNTLEDKIDNLDKKTEERFDHLEKYIFKEICRLDNKMDKRFEEMDVKLDKVLSAVSNLVIATEGMKQELTAIGEHVRQYEDRLSVLEK